MASTTIEKRISALFQGLDTNGDGFVDVKDYELVIGALAEKRGLQPGSDDYDTLRNSVMGSWDAIRERGDTDGDGRVSRDEYVQSMAELTESSEGLERVALSTAEQMILAMDTDGDGRLDRDEYGAMMGAWGATAEGLDAMFAHLDKDGDGFVTREEMLASVREMFDENSAFPPLWGDADG